MSQEHITLGANESPARLIWDFPISRALTHWPLGDFNLILGVAEVSLTKLPSDEWH